MLVEPGAFAPQIVRADDRRVAPGIAEANRALLEHRDVADAVLLGKVVSRREPMPAAADDDHLIARLRARLAPQWPPAAMAGERLAGQRAKGISLHCGSTLRRHLEIEEPRGVAAEDRAPLGIVERLGALDKADRIDLAHV